MLEHTQISKLNNMLHIVWYITDIYDNIQYVMLYNV